MNYLKSFSQKIYDLQRFVLIKWVLNPIILIVLWLLLSLIYSSEMSFTILQQAHYEDKSNELFNRRLLKGHIVSGEFKSHENYLGIISIKFGNVRKVAYEDEDTFIFRIKEAGQTEWIYENRYRSGIANPNEYFPFGFLPINKSKDRTYIFELESLSGTTMNALVTGYEDPIYITKYKYPKDEIFSNTQSLFSFIGKKVFTIISNYDLLLSTSIFLLPFIFYITWISIGNKYITYTIRALQKSKKYRRWARYITEEYIQKIYLPNRTIPVGITNEMVYLFLVVLVMIGYIIFSKTSFSGITIGLIGLWVIAIYKNRINSLLSYFLAFIFILISIFSIYVQWSINVNSASSLAYFFLITGIVQDVASYKDNTRTK